MRASRAVPVIIIVLVAALAAPSAGTAGPPGPPRSLRVLGFNVHAGTGADGRLDLERVARVIENSGADVAALQEVDVHWSARSDYRDQAAELARLTGMNVFFAPIYDLDPEPGHSARRRFGVAVLSRYPIEAARNHLITRLSTIEPDPVPALAPGLAEVLVRVGTRPVRVYTTHLDHRADPAVRRAQVADTLDVIEDRQGGREATLLLGDFNAEPGAPELGPLFTRLTDVWPAVHQGAPSGSGATYPAHAPRARIDYVTFAGAGQVLRARSAEVPAVLASDHRPVSAEFALT
ncbi:metal-dependent hydrolase [Prauserella marina]|uniref:Metal-dependent hydrolase, endonuclease/exonuclease/phosphatase family n=1 Tax=Prauserella marina TaxID=530584 RepID=A0A222VZ01_9PSEU|nr:endonuclease/exonuclease/phosphatase family protein [Prauserella marina]ASR39178.1 metal-dependent hydrolase [Prauserella marina]PWV84679.1 endonuclease/exonuclease/phosphatase family metal-dependent hydrolase [Prauserella marina]SDC15939.1 Metal-dependent hydrolase, endonuclease/exonuclease/phosphatase family [Prauserella marina]